MSIEGDLALIRRQETDLRFARFAADDAWAIGSFIRDLGAKEAWPIVVDIRRFDAQMFFVALPGSVPDNVDWVRRKSNVVQRFHQSSYGFGLGLKINDATIETKYGLASADYAPHGGAFPIHVQGAGVVGSITVSGLPQRDDHNAVVQAICTALRLPVDDYALHPSA